jgi:hypothetical protein
MFGSALQMQKSTKGGGLRVQTEKQAGGSLGFVGSGMVVRLRLSLAMLLMTNSVRSQHESTVPPHAFNEEFWSH